METSSPLRTYRTNAKLTLKEFASLFGVHKTTVLRWETGKIPIPAERVLPISERTRIPRHKLRPDLYARRPS